MPNKLEKIKAEKDCLEMEEALLRYSQVGWKEITPEDRERLKWWGDIFSKTHSWLIHDSSPHPKRNKQLSSNSKYRKNI